VFDPLAEDIRIVLEYLEKGLPLEIMAAGDQEHADLSGRIPGLAAPETPGREQ
jgi:hypothetical protein